MTLKKAAATAPAKIILCGEHAVVYGVPAIAIPVTSLQAHATVQEATDETIIIAEDTQERLTIHDQHPLARATQLALEQVNSRSNIQVTVTSTIPMASGLGSGAAVSAAIVRAIYRYHERPLDLQAINKVVYQVEKLHHGTPSGIDNTVIVYEQPVYFVKSQPIQTIEVATPFEIVIADTGQPASTKETVSHVAHLHRTRPSYVKAILVEIESLVEQAKEALRTGDATQLGQCLTRNHGYLRELEVSTPQLDQLVQVANATGALGAKLSGGGGGGNMIALMTHQTRSAVQKALLKAGATQVFTTTLEPTAC